MVLYDFYCAILPYRVAIQKYDNYTYQNYINFNHFMFFVTRNTDLIEDHFNKFNIRMLDAYWYFYCMYFLNKYFRIKLHGPIHFWIYRNYCLNELYPEKKKIFNDAFDKGWKEWILYKYNVDLKVVSPILSFPAINEKVKNYYHIFKNKMKKKSEPTVFNKSIIFNSSSIVKNINNETNYTLYFLRKNKTFNKGRYSRNRQNYRTGVYWCLYINIIALFGLYFYFYRFTFNFGHLWWLFFCFPASFIIPQAIRLRLYNPYIFYYYFISYIEFLYTCICIIFFRKK